MLRVLPTVLSHILCLCPCWSLCLEEPFFPPPWLIRPHPGASALPNVQAGWGVFFMHLPVTALEALLPFFAWLPFS